MTTRDKPIMRLVIDTIEKNGPMTVRALMSELCMTQNAVSKRCYEARNDGYLTMTFEREREMVGRKGAIYTRTAKPFDETIVSPKTLKERERKRRDRENEIARKLRAEAAKARKMIGQPFVPFRHPFDVILFGNCASSGRPSRVAGRVIQQSMSVGEEAEA
jgi:hypothetical protein